MTNPWTRLLPSSLPWVDGLVTAARPLASVDPAELSKMLTEPGRGYT